MGVDYHIDQGGINVRFGYANAEEGEAESFVSLGYEQQIGRGTLAGAYSVTHYNQDQNSIMRHAEVYYRFAAIDNILYFSPAVQWFEGGNIPDDSFIWGVRAEVWF